MNVTIALAWIPGLQEIPVNDTADSLAKHTSLEIYKGHLSATCFVTYNDAVRIAANIAKKSWEPLNRSGIKMFPDIIPDS